VDELTITLEHFRQACDPDPCLDGIDVVCSQDAARTNGGEATVVISTELGEVRARWQATKRYRARNQIIVDDSDRIIAFVAPDRTGGTEDTIRRAERSGKPVELR
jgi:hypothetical protein